MAVPLVVAGLEIPFPELKPRRVHEPAPQRLAINDAVSLADLTEFKVSGVFPQQRMTDILGLLSEHGEVHVEGTAQCLST